MVRLRLALVSSGCDFIMPASEPLLNPERVFERLDGSDTDAIVDRPDCLFAPTEAECMCVRFRATASGATFSDSLPVQELLAACD